MKLGRLIVLGVALGSGVLAAALALNLSQPRQQVAALVAAPKTDTVKVMVAAKDLRMGTTLKEDSVTWREWPRTSVSDKFVTEKAGEPNALTQVIGTIVRATFYEGEPISESKLIRSDRGFMSAILPEGKRAVAIKIAADTSAGGFILPNDRVDVIMTRKSEQSAETGGGAFLTETILNNVRVLAIDQTIEEKNGEKVVVGQTATLELSPQQAEIITVAGEMSGRLTLALRSIADSTVTSADAAADAAHLIGGTRKNGAVTVVKSGVVRDVTGIR